MRKILGVGVFIIALIIMGFSLPEDSRAFPQADNLTDIDDPVSEDCEWNGISLHGKIKFVESFPDIKIKVVESFPDLKVKLVNSFPNDCGEWQIVESFPDIKVQVVESFPDIKVKFVESFPGKP